MTRLLNWFQDQLDRTRHFDFLAPLLLRLYLAPIFWMAGTQKIDSMTLLPKEEVVAWFTHGLELPLPEAMAFMAAWTEVIGAVLLLAGFAVRWVSVPLMVTMIVAAVTVHWQNGWLAVAEGSGLFATDRTEAAVERLAAAKEILKEHGNYQWLTEHGNFVVLNNGIEFAATYFIMLLVLFFIGSGRYLSIDYWIARRYRPTAV